MEGSSTGRGLHVIRPRLQTDDAAGRLRPAACDQAVVAKRNAAPIRPARLPPSKCVSRLLVGDPCGSKAADLEGRRDKDAVLRKPDKLSEWRNHK